MFLPLKFDDFFNGVYLQEVLKGALRRKFHSETVILEAINKVEAGLSVMPTVAYFFLKSST